MQEEQAALAERARLAEAALARAQAVARDVAQRQRAAMIAELDDEGVDLLIEEIERSPRIRHHARVRRPCPHGVKELIRPSWSRIKQTVRSPRALNQRVVKKLNTACMNGDFQRGKSTRVPHRPNQLAITASTTVGDKCCTISVTCRRVGPRAPRVQEQGRGRGG